MVILQKKALYAEFPRFRFRALFIVLEFKQVFALTVNHTLERTEGEFTTNYKYVILVSRYTALDRFSNRL